MNTEDPYVVILEQGNNHVIYQDINSKEKWIIEGQCNQCGLCEHGRINYPFVIFADGIKIGEPYACVDILKALNKRNDIPLRPEGVNEESKCTLRGYYI